jgi:hypothetical protein
MLLQILPYYYYYYYCSAFVQLKLHTCVLNYVLLFSKLLIFDFLLSIPETFLCSVSALQVKNILLLDAFQLLKFVGTSTNIELKLFFLIVFYSDTFLIIK